MKMESHEIIDTLKDSACCLKCRTLQDPFAGCVCQQEELFSSMPALFGSLGAGATYAFTTRSVDND